MTGAQRDDHELVVIGGGTAGIIAARTAASLGARVLLVEAERTGGDCLWTGCVPSKTLIAAAAGAHRTRAGGPGVAAGQPKVDFPAVLARVRAAIGHIEQDDAPDTLRAAGVDIRHGHARFTGSRTLDVDGRPMRFGRAVVATGSTPAVPPIPGLAEVLPLTTDTVWDLTDLPARLVVLGGGPVGCELGQAFARLGCQVTIIEAGDRLVPREDPTASAVLAARLVAEGIRVRTHATVTRVTGAPGAITCETTEPAAIEADRVLVTAGRRPRVDGLDPDAAGIRTDSVGYVMVDRRLRTSNSRVYGAGDITGGPAFTHVAAMHGSVAASNALLGPLRAIDHDRMPRVTFTDPEIAQVGLTETEARHRHGDTIRVRSLAHDRLDRAVTEHDTDGFTRIVLDAQGRVLGATIVAPRAGEVITELAVLVSRGERLRELASVVHPYPSWSQAVWHLAVAESAAALARPLTRQAVRVLRRLRA